MSYYENRIKELEHRIEQMARANRLKAIPVEAQLIDRIAELNKENASLKAEVERLDTGIQPEGSNDAVGRAVNVLLEKEKEIVNLKAEAENSKRINTELLVLSNRQASDIRRLHKAGDAMALCITEFRCGKYGNALDKVGGFYVWQDWLTAKEGKPSV